MLPFRTWGSGNYPAPPFPFTLWAYRRRRKLRGGGAEEEKEKNIHDMNKQRHAAKPSPLKLHSYSNLLHLSCS